MSGSEPPSSHGKTEPGMPWMPIELEDLEEDTQPSIVDPWQAWIDALLRREETCTF